MKVFPFEQKCVYKSETKSTILHYKKTVETIRLIVNLGTTLYGFIVASMTNVKKLIVKIFCKKLNVGMVFENERWKNMLIKNIRRKFHKSVTF